MFQYRTKRKDKKMNKNICLNFNEDTVKVLSAKYNVPMTDVLLIALNRYGILADIPDKRIRFKLSLYCNTEIFYLAVCVNTFPSPFSIGKDGVLQLAGVSIGQMFDFEKDTCDSTYFRRNKTELTLNSNMRSQCHGCTFCGTYNLDPDDRVDLSDKGKMRKFVEDYLKSNLVNNLSDLLRITLCTGCFVDEMALVEHIISLYEVLGEYGFSKRIHYIGSQIRSTEAMRTIKQTIPFFSLSLTVECFTDRKKRMRVEKGSLDLRSIHDILLQSKSFGFSTKYLYIVGLDSLDEMEKGVVYLANVVNRLPIFQIMQNYVPEHENERVLEAQKIEYYLKARKVVEKVMGDSDMKPRSWENYRGLFYTQYRNQAFDCIRI